MRIHELVDRIKRDYQSPASHGYLRGVIKDVLSVFDGLAELRASGDVIVFKKMPRWNDVLEKYDAISKRMPKDPGRARDYIRNLIRSKKSP